MPRMHRPTFDQVFVITYPDGYSVYTRMLSMTVNSRTDEWEATLAEGHVVTSTDNKWPMYNKYRPIEWVLQGAAYFPVDSPERFPDATIKDTLASYWKRVGEFEGSDVLTDEARKTIFEVKLAKVQKVQAAAKASSAALARAKTRVKRANR